MNLNFDYKISPKDKIFVIPVLICLFIIGGFLLSFKSSLGGLLFFGSIIYFSYFIVSDIISKEKDINKRLKISEKEKMDYYY